MSSEYIDFDLSIDSRGGNEYEVSARSDVAGEASPRPRVQIDLDSLDTDVDIVEALLRGSSPHGSIVGRRNGQDAVQALGSRLFSTVMTAAVAERYRVALHEAEHRSAAGVRIRLRIQAPQVAALPWELMYDEGRRDFLCTSRRTPIVRYIEVGRAPETLRIEYPLRVLGVVSSPSDLAALDKHNERARVDRALQELEREERVRVTWLARGTFDELQSALRKEHWHVVHYIGHGDVDPESGHGVLLLEKEDGTSDAVSAAMLQTLFGSHQWLRLVVLNSCDGARANGRDVFSSTAAALVRGGTPAVVAMQFAITDTAAIDFAQAFYEALADRTPIDAAVSEARLKLRLTHDASAEWATPVVFMRSASGALFTTEEHQIPRASFASWLLVVGAVFAMGVCVLVLAATRPPRVELNARISASALAFRLDAAQSIGPVLPLDTLFASPIWGVDSPDRSGQAASGVIRAEKVFAASRSPTAKESSLRLDLEAAELPRASRIAMVAGGPRGNQLRIDISGRLPIFGATMRGPMHLEIDDRPHDVDLATGGRLEIYAAPRSGDSARTVLEVFTGQSVTQFAPRLIVNRLELFRLEANRVGEMRRQTTIRAGTLRISGGRVDTLGPTTDLRFGAVHGNITQLALAGTTLSFSFSGWVDSLSKDTGSGLQNLMPTRWQAMSGAQRTVALIAAALFGFGLVALARRAVQFRGRST